MSGVSSVLADRKNGVRPLLTKLNQLMEGVQGQEAGEILTKINALLNSVSRIVEKTELKSNSLSRLLYDDHFYNNLNKTLGNLDKLVVDLKSHPWRYFNFSVFGRTQGHEQAETE